LNEVAYFDLFPLNDLVQFSGTWSNYQYLPSGINLATSMYDGFFITRPTFLKWNKNQHDVCLKGSFDAQLQVNTNLYFPLQVSIDNPSWLLWEGPSVVETTGNYSFHFSVTANAPSGHYQLPVNLIAPNGQSYTVEVQMNISGSSAPNAPTLLLPTEFEVVGFNPVYFSWSPSNGATAYEITIATDADFTQNVLIQNTFVTSVALPMNTTGLHYWKVVAKNDCGSSWKEQGSFYLMSTAIDEVNRPKDQWIVYPNPAREEFTLENVQGPIRVMDVTGRTIYQFSPSSDKIKIYTSDWAEGVYFIQNGEGVQPLVIRH
jgi:hypothetical protein